MSNIPPLGPPTGMMPGGGSSKFKPIDPVRVMRANWLWIAVALIVGLMIGGGTWYALNKYAAKYTSDARFNVQATGDVFNNAGPNAGGAINLNVIEQHGTRDIGK